MCYTSVFANHTHKLNKISSGRKSKSLTLDDKLKVIDSIQTRSKKKKYFNNEFGIPCSILSSTLINEKKIIQKKIPQSNSNVERKVVSNVTGTGQF